MTRANLLTFWGYILAVALGAFLVGGLLLEAAKDFLHVIDHISRPG